MATTNPEKAETARFLPLRGQVVMLERDLAEVYEVQPKRIRQAVMRNSERFPEDFMFRMEKAEFENWRARISPQQASLKEGKHTPYCFTQQGATMLACVLKSKKSIEFNITIIRAFTKMRGLSNENNLPATETPNTGLSDSKLSDDTGGRKEKRVDKSQVANNKYQLSTREHEVLRLLVDGLSYKMIACRLNITYDTVRAHMKKIYIKLHVASMTEAVAKAINQKLLAGA